MIEPWLWVIIAFGAGCLLRPTIEALARVLTAIIRNAWNASDIEGLMTNSRTLWWVITVSGVVAFIIVLWL